MKLETIAKSVLSPCTLNQPKGEIHACGGKALPLSARLRDGMAYGVDSYAGHKIDSGSIKLYYG